MRTTIGLPVALALAALVMAAEPVVADTPAARAPVEKGHVSATLEGEPLPFDAVGAWACHDFEYPIIRCFQTEDRLMAALKPRSLERHGAPGAVTADSAGYVMAYDLTYYGGSNPKALSTDQPWLVLIGWNDVTSSFKSFGATGRWWEHSPTGGVRYVYGATTQVPTLSSTYNNKFSAFEID